MIHPPVPSRDMADLIRLMAMLRDPVAGCEWDLAQTYVTIAPYTIEEAYEVADAIARADRDDLCEELGDLLLQVVFHARMAEEDGAFTFSDVVFAITSKLIRRHPHVFGEARRLPPDAIKKLWDEIKSAEKAARSTKTDASSSALDGVAHALPALMRAEKLQSKASRVGFDWNDPQLVLDKIQEEIAEVREAMTGGDQAAIAEELGDLLFAAANLARHLKVDPETALRDANAKFERRFRGVEFRLAAQGIALADAGLDAMEAQWCAVKIDEKAG